MNHPIRRVALAAMVMFAAMLLNISAGYLIRTDGLNERSDNRRVTDAWFARDRGPIMVGNTPIAKSEPVKDRFKFQRSYPSGKLYAPVTGFHSYYFGTSGLENSFAAQLIGVDDSQFLDRLVNTLTGTTPRGASVETTLSAKAQRAAWDGLDGRKGAVIAMDTKTGAIRVMVTSPSYDPNQLATHDLKASRTTWEELTADKSRPMSNRATREIYPPGSTFKLITAAAALEAGMSPNTKIDASVYKLPGSSVQIRGNCGGSEVTLSDALKVSCNPGFARLGVELGADALREQAERFGFGDKFLSDLGGSVASRFPEDPDDAQTGMSAIGAFDVAATPLQMMLVAAAVQNGGVVMEPYLVQSVMTHDMRVISEAQPRQHGTAVSASVADSLHDMMVSVVTHGTGRRAQIPGLTIGGKTGTAVTEGRRPYAWFTAFADELDLAVTVFIEDAEIPATDIAGGTLAAPIAKAVIEAMR